MPKAEIKPRTRYTRRVGDTHNPESLLQCLLVAALGLDETDITTEAALVDDLGAESIDFVDISFRMEQAFGCPLPTREWADAMQGAMGQLTPAELAEWLEQRHGLHLSDEDVQGLEGLGLREVRECLANKHSLTLPDDEVTELARLGVQRNARTFEEIFGLSVPPVQFDLLLSLAHESVFSEEFRRATAKVFTVDMLRNFVLRRVGLVGEPTQKP